MKRPMNSYALALLGMLGVAGTAQASEVNV